MSDLSGPDEKDYVFLKDFKVQFRRDGDEEEADECFALCFWIYIDNCVSYPSAILVQKQTDVTCNVPFLYLDDKKKMKLFPLLSMHKEAPDSDNPILWTEVPCISTEFEFLTKKWVHVGCEVLRDLMRLHVDGEIVGEKPFTSFNKDLYAEDLKQICLEYPSENKDILHGYVHGLDILFQEAAIRNHYVKESPVQLTIDHSSTSEIEEDSDGVWSIVGGKASCRRIFSLDVVLLDAFGGPLNKDLEVVACLLYADNGIPVENTTDAEPPLLINCDGIEYASHDRPCKLINGRASFKLKISQDDNAHAMSMKRRPADCFGIENNSCASDNSEATNSDPKSVLSVSSPISDLIIFQYCLGGLAERCHLLKEIAISTTEDQLAHFANQVSMFSGCLHHRHQIQITKRLVEEGIQAWTSASGNNHQVVWENLVFSINEHFMKISRSTRPLMDQDLECLRKIAGCRDVVLQEDFERMWSWLYPVAFTLSLSAVNAMWNSMSPIWIEGFVTKEEAESSLQGPGGLQDPGTFVLRFPTSRSWPHPDAGNLVVTYVDNDYTIHHRLLSFDFIHCSASKGMTAKPLQDLLLQEPKLSQLGRMMRSQ